MAVTRFLPRRALTAITAAPVARGLTVKTTDAEPRQLFNRAARMRELLGMRHDFPMRRDLWPEAKKVIVRPPASTAASHAEVTLVESERFDMLKQQQGRGE